MKHTPGEWEVNKIETSDYFSLAILSHEQEEVICHIFNWGEKEISEANAKLIAAAPDLLKALQDIMGWVNHTRDKDLQWAINANQAIKKATI